MIVLDYMLVLLRPKKVYFKYTSNVGIIGYYFAKLQNNLNPIY